MRTPDENAELIALAAMLGATKAICLVYDLDACCRFATTRAYGGELRCDGHPHDTRNGDGHITLLLQAKFVRRFEALLAKGDKL